MIHRFPATQRLCKPTQILRRNQTQETRRGSEENRTRDRKAVIGAFDFEPDFDFDFEGKGKAAPARPLRVGMRG
jgi:hypothetical protein